MKKWILLAVLLVVIIGAFFVKMLRPENAPVSSIPTATPSTEMIATQVAEPTRISSAEPVVRETAVIATPTDAAENLPKSDHSKNTFAVIGDSNSEPYEFINRGGPDSYAWTEILRDLRNVDFGEEDRFLVAHSGDRTRHIATQIDQLSQPIQNNEIEKVIIWIGWNDFRALCRAPTNQDNLLKLEGKMTSNLENGIDQLLALRMESEHIYMLTQSSRDGDPNCDNVQQVNQVVAAINERLLEMADEYGFNLIDANIFPEKFAPYIINESGDILIDGVTIAQKACNQQTCIFTADGHANTVISGIVANVFFADVFGVYPLSDTELVEAAGLK